MILSPRNDADLLWFFNVADIGRSSSTFGSMLDRQASRYRDSAGRILPTVTSANSWQYISVSSDTPRPGTSNEPSYTPDHTTSVRVATISRKLSMLSLEHQKVLALYHGAVGAEWEREFGRSRRCYCLIPLLPSGQRWLKPLYGKYASLSQDLITRLEVTDQDDNPNDIRGKQIEKLEQECYRLRMAAERAYQAIVLQ